MIGSRKYSLDKNNGKTITGRTEIRLGTSTKVDNTELISVNAKIAITGSVAHERQPSEVISTVKTLD